MVGGSGGGRFVDGKREYESTKTTFHDSGARPTARPSISALDSYGAPLAPPLSLDNQSKENDGSGVIIAKNNPTVVGIKSPKSSDSKPTYFNYVPPLEDQQPKVKLDDDDYLIFYMTSEQWSCQYLGQLRSSCIKNTIRTSPGEYFMY